MPDHEPVTDDEILSGFKSLLQAIELGFGKINGRIDSLQSSMNGRMDSLQASISGLEQRTLRRFDQIDGRLAANDVRFDRIEARLDRIEGRLDGIDALLKTHDEGFLGLRAQLRSIDARLGRVEPR